MMDADWTIRDNRSGPLMRRCPAIVLLVLASLSVGGSPFASAQNLNCDDFSSQGEAQAVLAADPSDPNGLDGDSDGIACESLPGGGGQPSASVPQTQPDPATVTEPRAEPATVTEPVNQVEASTGACADYDAQVWAQTVYESDEDQFAALDPDGDGIACPELPDEFGGFAPTLWADEIPRGAEEATVLDVGDGDTFDVRIASNDQIETVRLYQIDTPETRDPNDPDECGGAEATAFLELVLSVAPESTLYLQFDRTQYDRFDRRLAYAWFELDGDVYLVNEVMVRNGFAEHRVYEPDRRHERRFEQAAEFAEEHQYGVLELCEGRFDLPLSEQPVAAQEPQEPVQQQEPAAVDPQPQQPVQEPQQPAQTGCDPSYPGVCIPPAPPDLDCGQVSYSGFAVVPPDPHGFDGDGNGVGCE
ncbi:MAG: excalibur calcium-binding domain-containing protein [Chloroflexia bacterium]|nr:excalibur calcium-binding domain-containing protein [Chloroflexia bacterium]